MKNLASLKRILILIAIKQIARILKTKKSTTTIFDKDNSELDEPEYMGQDINDPGPYSLYKRMN